MAFAAVQAGNNNSGQTFKSANFDPQARARAARSTWALKPVESRLKNCAPHKQPAGNGLPGGLRFG